MPGKADVQDYEDVLGQVLRNEVQLKFGMGNINIIGQLLGRGLQPIDFEIRDPKRDSYHMRLPISKDTLPAVHRLLETRFGVQSISATQLSLRMKYQFISVKNCPICGQILDEGAEDVKETPSHEYVSIQDYAVVCNQCGAPYLYNLSVCVQSLEDKCEEGEMPEVKEIGYIVCEGFVPAYPANFAQRARSIYNAYRMLGGGMSQEGRDTMLVVTNKYLEGRGHRRQDQDSTWENSDGTSKYPDM